MKQVYPVIFTAADGGYVAHVPDMDIDTQGSTLIEAIEMARDAIGIMGIDMQDEGKDLPQPSKPEEVASESGEIVSMVDIDFTAYRRAQDMRTVRRNVSLPSYLNQKADELGINVSQLLQEALRERLGIS